MRAVDQAAWVPAPAAAFQVDDLSINLSVVPFVIRNNKKQQLFWQGEVTLQWAVLLVNCQMPYLGGQPRSAQARTCM